MKIECLKNKLEIIVSKAEKIVSKNQNLPILSCLLIVAKEKTISIKATNLDLGVELNIPAKVIKEGVVAIPANIFSNYLNSIKDDKPITLELVNDNLKITTDKSSTTIKTLPYEDFPFIPRIEPESAFSIKIKDFLNGIKSVYFSASTSSIKPELGSIYINNEGDSLVFVATDSFRLSEKKIKFSSGEGNFNHILIPVKNAVDILKILDGFSGDVEIVYNNNQIGFIFEDNYITSRIVDGSFPDYKQIIPKEPTTIVNILKQDVVDALRGVNVFLDKFNQVKITALKNNKDIVFETKNGEVGEIVEKIKCATSGEDISISFNQRYLIDCFNSVSSDSVIFNFSGNNKPLIITGQSDKSFTYLVMPMNRN